jgi:hypothetical protein
MLNCVASVAAMAAGLGLAGWGHAAAQSLDAAVKLSTNFQGDYQRSLLLKPGWKTRLGDARLDLELRLEVADDDVGLGAVSGFSPLSEPLIATDDVRIEIEEATIRIPLDDATLILGKQVIAWGKLDGIRVADAFNPVRLNEFVLTDERPERIALWAARLRGDIGPVQYDLGWAPDPTVDQLPNPGDLYFPDAPRFRADLPPGLPLPRLERSSRQEYIDDAVYGLQLATTIGPVDLAASVVSGPQHQAVLVAGLDGNGQPFVLLDHPRRTQTATSVAFPAGPTVVRFEAAVIEEEAFNTNMGGMVGQAGLQRSLVGVGIDWNAPADLFVNAQLVADTVHDAPEGLVRERQDVIATLRAQRGFSNDRWQAQLETLISAGEGDFVARPSLSYDVNDTYDLTAGADLFGGDDRGLFGQFTDDGSRLWLAVSASW